MNIARTFTIRRMPRQPSRDQVGMDEYPWYVSETTHGDDRDDYGRMASFPEALDLVASMVANPES
jgi:hypothetical protein